MRKLIQNLGAFLAVTLLIAVGLTSCDFSGLLGKSDGKVTVYGSGVSANVITSAAATDNTKLAAESLSAAISNKGAKVESALDIHTVNGSKIFVGQTSDPVSEYAEELLEAELSSNEVGYVICVKDGALALYSDDDTALILAVEYFVQNYVTKSSLTLDEGFVKTVKMTSEEFENMKKQTEWERRWDNVELKVGADVTEALKSLYDFYGDSVYKWIANLYDIENGGFYYANSARDTVGFLPDIESTTQALWLITATGLTKEYGDDLSKALPEKVVEQTLDFVYSLFDESDGYFYHKQWGKNINSSRRGRDINSSIDVINKLGGKVPDNTALDRLEGGTAQAAAARVLAASSVKPVGFLSSEAELLAWLESLNIENDSHTAGHTIESVASQIRAAGYSKFVLDWLDSKQLETGLWQPVSESNPYMALSGLLKIGSCYNNFGGQMKHCDSMVDTAIDVILSNVDPYIVIYVYNPWGGLKYALQNIISANKANPGTYDYDSSFRKVLDSFPDMIDVTINKLKKFQKADGSFSYYQKVSAAYTQGTLVSLGKEEGDVNGTSLGMTTMFTTLFDILGLPVVRMYNSDDYDVFINILNNLEPVEKQPKPEFDTIDFEDGNMPVYVTTYATAAGSTLEIVEDLDKEGNENQALHVVSPGGIGDQITFKADSSADGMMSYTFDYDMKVMSGSVYSHQISLLTPTGSIAYMMTLHVNGSTVSFKDTTSNAHQANANSFTMTAKTGEWFHVRMEYHVMEGNTVRFKLYINGEYAGESQNFYGKYAQNGSLNANAVPQLAVERLQIYSMLSSSGEFYLDNLDYEFFGESTYGDK